MDKLNMDNLPSMSIFGLGTSANHRDTATNSLLPTAGTGQSAFKRLLEATSTTSLESGSTPEQDNSLASTDRKAIIHNFLNRLWQNNPIQGDAVDFSTPMKFVKSIAEPAQKAAAQLGTSTQAVIAIAALETGWGKHVIEVREGHSSNNLFGIKSNAQKVDSTVFANTTEYINGRKLTLEQPFRTYSTAAESVGDFADFIRANPRYEHALSSAHDAHNFIEQIHRAGYATDPEYATKVKSVMANVEKMMNSPQYHQPN